jgi:aminomethyltransferase
MEVTEQLKHTPLYAAHVALGAKMVPFGGWEMPVVYDGILGEHAAVREQVGLFDVSHMGQVLAAGPNAERVLNHLFTNDVRKLAVGQAQYTLMCNDHGGVIDDLIVYRIGSSLYLIVVNASHIESDFEWITRRANAAVVFDNESEKTAMLAVQGPNAAKFLAIGADIPHFYIAPKQVFGIECRVARTGYTGEDGFEIMCDAGDAPGLWEELLAHGQPFGIRPCGLGARDTLRLEMCYPLNGNDMTGDTTPLEAGLGKFVSFDKGEFVGRETLREQKEHGTQRKLVAFKMTEKSPPPRSHYPITTTGTEACANGTTASRDACATTRTRRIGEITSGTQSPTLGIGIGMGYVESQSAAPGSKIGIEIRGKTYSAVIENKPLLKRKS